MKTRESRYVRVARIAYRLAEETVPRYAHPKSPHRFTQPQLVACVLLMVYVKVSYRDMEEWLLASDQVCQVLELKQVPDHSTLSRAFKRLRLADLERMNRQLLDQLGVGGEEVIGLDATGYSPTQASVYYRTRSRRSYTRWVKGVYAVGAGSQMILAWRQGKGPGGDNVFLNGLRRAAARYGKPHWLLVADAGFDGRSARPTDLIPPIRKGRVFRGWVDPQRRARAERVAAARLDGVMGLRWLCETAHSVIKRKFGDTIRSRSRQSQRREPAIKGLVYNIHR